MFKKIPVYVVKNVETGKYISYDLEILATKKLPVWIINNSTQYKAEQVVINRIEDYLGFKNVNTVTLDSGAIKIVPKTSIDYEELHTRFSMRLPIGSESLCINL